MATSKLNEFKRKVAELFNDYWGLTLSGEDVGIRGLERTKDNPDKSVIETEKSIQIRCMFKEEVRPWDVQLMYQHKGFGPQIVSLSQVMAFSFEKALETAKRNAELCIIEIGEDRVEKWDVRIRPAQK